MVVDVLHNFSPNTEFSFCDNLTVEHLQIQNQGYEGAVEDCQKYEGALEDFQCALDDYLRDAFVIQSLENFVSCKPSNTQKLLSTLQSYLLHAIDVIIVHIFFLLSSKCFKNTKHFSSYKTNDT